MVKGRAGFPPSDVRKVEQGGKAVIRHARGAKNFSLRGQMKAVQAIIADSEGMEKEAPEV